ncbi:MAG: flagellar FliJ family protein [Bryobacter sp.]|nr:flagellar FliJ family protein [Bryobacter sp.]
MKKFDFRLERVLELRRMEAELEQARLAAKEAELTRLRGTILRLDEDYQTQLALTGLDAQERAQLGQYRQHYESRRRQAEAQVSQQAERVERQRQVTTGARQKVEVLEKVKQKQRNEWERQLQKELDEAAMDSFLTRWRPGTPVQ